MRQKIELPIIIERVKIEGPTAAREVNLLLDTGSRFTVLNWDILKDIGYDPAIIGERVSLVTANGIIEAPLLKVESISLGELLCKATEVIAYTIPEFVGVDGLLGLNFLSHYRTVIDYREKVIEIV